MEVMFRKCAHHDACALLAYEGEFADAREFDLAKRAYPGYDPGPRMRLAGGFEVKIDLVSHRGPASGTEFSRVRGSHQFLS